MFRLILKSILGCVLDRFWIDFGCQKVAKCNQLYVRGATAAPKEDRQIQIEGMFFLEAAATGEPGNSSEIDT